ncbi:MerR family transcriptional regulator [Streptomyces sp. NPDC002835]|jgi:MerR family redox-sensitive transcriptional activator SoxR
MPAAAKVNAPRKPHEPPFDRELGKAALPFLSGAKAWMADLSDGSVAVEASFKSTLSGEFMDDTLLSISEVARRAGIATSALRYYERCSLIPEGVKVAGRRHYPPAVLHRLSAIKICQRIGFSLAEISGLLQSNGVGGGVWRHVATARRSQVEREIVALNELLRLIDQTLDCDCRTLCDCPHMGPDGPFSAAAQEAEEDGCCELEPWPSQVSGL